MLVARRSKNHMIFSAISILQQNIEKFDELWVVDAGCFWFIYLFLFSYSDLNIRHYCLQFFWGGG